MSNPSKAKGTRGESALVDWLRLYGFPGADRKPLSGARDKGDVALAPGVIAEVKTFRLPTGYPTAGQVTAWLKQAASERINAKADYCVLIVKRAGTTDVGRWFAFLPFIEFAVLTDGYMPLARLPKDIYEQPVMLTVAAMAAVLRSTGYGTPLEESAA